MTFKQQSLCLLFAALAVSAAQAQRLPGNVRPDHYLLALTPDLKTATFSGTETIDVTLAAPSKTITLNALELKIDTVTANGEPGTVSFDPEKEQATFTFEKPLPSGRASI